MTLLRSSTATVAMLAWLSTAIGCARGDEPNSGTTAGQIAESPDTFVGQTVRLHRAEVENVRTSRLFTVDEDNLGAAPDVMVLIPVPAKVNTITDGTVVDIVGVVRKMSGAAFKRDYHWWSEGAFTTEIDMIGARPVIVAHSVRSSQGVEFVSPEARTRQ